MITLTRRVEFRKRPDQSHAVVVADAMHPVPAPVGRVPRISRLMALAIHLERLIREGKVRDQSELARLAHVSQPRITQIMNLNLLAPDIQEELLALPLIGAGRDAIHERSLRVVAGEPSWKRQRRAWRQFRGAKARGDRPPT